MTLLAPFLDAAARHPERAAIIDRAGVRVSFGELARWSAALAHRFQARGMQPGTRVLIAWPVSRALYAGLIALWRMGAVAVLPEASGGLAGVRHAARATAPQALLAPAAIRAALLLFAETRAIPKHLTIAACAQREPGPEPFPPSHPALISFTSGSTGAPKAIVRSHGLLLAQQAAIARLLAPPAGESAVDLVWFPAFVLAELALGVTSVLPDASLKNPAQADAETLVRQMDRNGVTRVLLPPAVCARLAGASAPPPLAAVFTGGGPVFPHLLNGIKRWAGAAEVHAVYGSTEAEPIAHVAHAQISPADFDAMASGEGLLTGTPVPEIAVRLIDGEIVVAGPHVNEGYLDPKHDAATKLAEGGRVWHRTGDGGRLDAKGRLWLTGRLAGRVAGLSPFAIECAALSWPGVTGAALVALSGDAERRADWQLRAAKLGVPAVRHLKQIPLDRRHNSKVDYAALARLLAQ